MTTSLLIAARSACGGTETLTTGATTAIARCTMRTVELTGSANRDSQRMWINNMPMERERYPTNWKDIANAVKEAAGWKCQKCGKQCKRPGEKFDTHKNTLTVAHLNHTPEDVRPENLMAMCAPCHLKYDAEHHAETRKKRRMKTDA